MRVSPRASAALRAATPALLQTTPFAGVLDSRFRGNDGEREIGNDGGEGADH